MMFEITPVRHVQGKLADVAIRFEPGEPLAGFTLLGFQIWEPRDGNPLRSITYPSRTWRLPNGGTGTVVLLRDERTDKFTDAPVSIALKAAMLAAGAMLATRCCTSAMARSSVEWKIILTVAAAFALGTAVV